MARKTLEKVDVRRAVSTAPYRDLPVMIQCRFPGHKDDTTSLAVYRDHIYCYGCMQGEQRRMDALGFLLGTDYRGAIAVAEDFYELEQPPEKEEVNLRPLSKGTARSYHRLLYGMRRDRLGWLFEKYGLSEESVKSFQIGHDGTRYSIPVYDAHGNLVTFRYRQDPKSAPSLDDDEKPGRKYSGVYQRNQVRLYPEWEVAESKEDFIVVCEGEFDAIRLWQEGIPACTPINGAGNLEKVLELLKPYHWIKKLYIAGDQDAAGEKGSQALAAVAKAAGYEVVILTWPAAMGKDVSELLEWKDTEYDEYIPFRGLAYRERAGRRAA